MRTIKPPTITPEVVTSGVDLRGVDVRNGDGQEIVAAQPIEARIPKPLLESLRYLLNRVELRQGDALPVRLAVTSSIHREGVTTISLNLASLLANDLDRRVCWIDLSWSTRRSSRSPAAAAVIGVADVLAGRATIDEAVRASIDPRLCVLPAGTPSGAGEHALLRGPHTAALLDELERRFDTLVLDFPPILTGSEALALTRYATAYLVVVRHGVTMINQVTSATDEIPSLPCLGVVLNQYRSSIPKRIGYLFTR